MVIYFLIGSPGVVNCLFFQNDSLPDVMPKVGSTRTRLQVDV